MSPRIEDEERFWAKVNLEADGGCWEWTANTGIGNRYGSFVLHGKQRPAHRVAYEWLIGPIPPGLELDHLCRNTKCVNPYHLEAVTHRENVLRGMSPMAVNARKTHCQKHPAEELVQATVGRFCRVCRREANRTYRIRQGGTGSMSEGNKRTWARRTPEENAALRKRMWASRRRKAHADPVSAAAYEHVIERDKYLCVGPVVGLPGDCEGVGEVDHVDNAGKNKRGPSIPTNLVCLCSRHHLYKTHNSREVRPKLRSYIARMEGQPSWWDAERVEGVAA